MNEYTRTTVDAARTILASGDGTYDLDGGRIVEADGFEVGGFDPGMPEPAKGTDNPTTLVKLANRIHFLRQRAPEVRVGIWTDPATGLIHLDGTRWFRQPFITGALVVARVLDQLAIWSWKQERAIDLSDRNSPEVGR